MKETIQKRLTALQDEHEKGRKMLAELDERRASLAQTLLRIEGAIQVLTEMAGPDRPATAQLENGLSGREAAPPS
jgi:hypothetical protein